MKVQVTQLPHAHGLDLPAYATPDSAGLDLSAAVLQPLILPPGGRQLIPTGLIMAIPSGYEGQIRPRSGLALKHGVTVLNSPGTIDADYRNEVMILLINHGQAPFQVCRGDRVAQLIIAPVSKHAWVPAASPDELGKTERGLGGYGSTGV